MKGEYKVPLFLIQEEPLLVYIVNNRIISCFFHPSNSYYGAPKSFNLLFKLFSSSHIPSSIPEELSNHFINKAPFHVEDIFNFVIGGKGMYDGHFLDFDLLIANTPSSKVEFTNFHYNEYPLNERFSLPFFETFILLSNHLVNSRSGIFCDSATESLTISNLSQPFPAPRLLDEVVPLLDPHQIIDNYLTDYLHFVKISLLASTISPSEFLRLNGLGILHIFKEMELVKDYTKDIFTKIVDYSHIPETELAVYYTFLNLYDKEWFLDNPPKEMEDFFQIKNIYFEKIEKILNRRFRSAP